LKDVLQQMRSLNSLNRISIFELLKHPFFHVSDEFGDDLIEPLFIPELIVHEDIAHISAASWKSYDFPLIKSFILASLSMKIISFGLAFNGFND
jgi:serine/threonine protein kinase